MGLISTALISAGSVLSDQWKEYFYCDSIPADVLVVKGKKRNRNNRGNDNIISNGSIIAIAEGQCMIIVEQGKVVDLCAEAGEYTYDMSTEPSLFYGSLSENIPEIFKLIGKRFTFAGDTAKDQQVLNKYKIPYGFASWGMIKLTTDGTRWLVEQHVDDPKLQKDKRLKFY